MSNIRILMVVAIIGATPAPISVPSYSLDHIALDSTVDNAIRALGKPALASSTTYEWTNAAGGKVTLQADASGHVVVIDVVAGTKERREIDAAGGSGTLGETGHVNFLEPPGAALGDLCGAGLVGSPCEVFTLPGDVDLVANFGKDNGYADWALSELVLGPRNLLLASGRVVASP